VTAPARAFPFGREPARTKAEQTAPLPPPDPQKTERLADFMPAASILPFRAPLLPPPLHPLVPPPPRRTPVRAPLSLRHAAAMVLLVLDVVVLLYLAATWRR
jgi:hypothetical protein